MFGAHLQTLIQLAHLCALVVGIAVGWAVADIVEMSWRKHP